MSDYMSLIDDLTQCEKGTEEEFSFIKRLSISAKARKKLKS